jgi:hypothetical protein
MPTNDEQFIDVILEDPKLTQKDKANNKENHEPEELDDTLFDMTTPN